MEHGTERNLFIRANTRQWSITGQEYQAERELRGISRARIARMTSYAPSTIAKFESGQPVMGANKIGSAYCLALELISYMRQEEHNSRQEAVKDTFINSKNCEPPKVLLGGPFKGLLGGQITTKGKGFLAGA